MHTLATQTSRRFAPVDAFDLRLLGSRLLVLCATGSGEVGQVTAVSGRGLTLDAQEIDADDVKRLWILRPSNELLQLARVGRWVRVLRADRSRVAGRVLEELSFGGFLVLTSAGVVEVAWLDVQQIEPCSLGEQA